MSQSQFKFNRIVLIVLDGAGIGAMPDAPEWGDACGKCGSPLVMRVDDGVDIVRERLKVYQRATRPVLEYYRERPTFRVVNGAQAPERVAHELDTMIDDAATVGAAILKAGQ